jgi:hypothetical protein
MSTRQDPSPLQKRLTRTTSTLLNLVKEAAMYCSVVVLFVLLAFISGDDRCSKEFVVRLFVFRCGELGVPFEISFSYVLFSGNEQSSEFLSDV